MSFFLVQNKINEVVVSCFENQKLNNPIYLFEFINYNNKPQYCICYDASQFKQRYQSFTVELINGADPLNSQVTLDTGDYSYKIYEQLSTTNTNPKGLNILEIGSVNVVSDAPIKNKEYDLITTNITYGG